MPNENRNRLNQPPTGQGKKQSPRSGAENKLDKRSEVLQAAGLAAIIPNVQKQDDKSATDLHGRTLSE
jgi:hypothetical protein